MDSVAPREVEEEEAEDPAATEPASVPEVEVDSAHPPTVLLPARYGNL